MITFCYLVINHLGISSAIQHLWIKIPVKKHHLCLYLCFQIQKGGKAPRAGIWRLLHPTSVLLSKSTKAGTQSLDSYSVGWSCLSRELGAHDPLCSLPALPILQFCDSSLLYFFPKQRARTFHCDFKSFFLLQTGSSEQDVVCVRAFTFLCNHWCCCYFVLCSFFSSGVTLKPLWFFFLSVPYRNIFLLHLRSHLFLFFLKSDLMKNTYQNAPCE